MLSVTLTVVLSVWIVGEFICSFIHLINSVACVTTGSEPNPKQVLQTV
jgi:hypothetical protein